MGVVICIDDTGSFEPRFGKLEGVAARREEMLGPERLDHG
jgi:hypothetical protein